MVFSQEPSSASSGKKESPTGASTSGKNAEPKARGPLIPTPQALPASVDTKGEVRGVPKAEGIVRDQQSMRKKLREEQKAAAAAKETQKAMKEALQKEKDALKEKKKAEKAEKVQQQEATKAAKKAAKAAKEKTKDEPKDGDDKTEETTCNRKRKAPEDGNEKPASKRRAKHALSATPCKVWGTPGKPKGKTAKKNSDKKGTPKKVKERRKREQKAQQSLMKLRRQKVLLAKALNDLPEPTDESKMILIF